MALVLAGAGVDQDGVARRADHKGLVGDHHHPERGVEHLRLHAGQMMPENGLVIGRKEILRPPPRPLPLDDRVDGDVADPELLHGRFAPLFRGSVTGESSADKPRPSVWRHAFPYHAHRALPNGSPSSATPALPVRCARHIRYSRRHTGGCPPASAPARGWRARPENAGHARRTAWCPRIRRAR